MTSNDEPERKGKQPVKGEVPMSAPERAAYDREGEGRMDDTKGPSAAWFLFWCKTKDGIIEHVTTKYEGHRGHWRCVPVEEVTNE